MNEREAYIDWCNKDKSMVELSPEGAFKAGYQAALTSQEPVALMDSTGTCAVTLHMVKQLEARDESGSFPYELWPTKLYTSPQSQPDLQDANCAFEICKKIAMEMPLNIKEHTKYRQNDDCKAMAWDIASAIDEAMKAKG
jgi:hypothetical protein